MAKLNIDVDDIRDPNEPAPAGNYTLSVKSYEATASKAGDSMIKAQFQIVGDGEHAGKTIFDYMVLEGKAARFGLWRHKQIADATDSDPTDTDSFIGKTFEAEIEVDPGNGEYGPSNRIRQILF
jgi:hypothetical protein